MTTILPSSAHTPGPWRIERSIENDRAIIIFSDKNDEYVCSMILDDPEMEANARLIAAAPEILEALDMLMSATVDEQLAQGIELYDHEVEARDAALAAMAKTDG